MFSRQARAIRTAVATGLGLLVAWLAACGDGAAARRGDAPAAQRAERDSGIRLVDDGGREVRLAAPARRVISLIPSATETVIALGAAGRVVGRTRYDVAPEVAAAPSVGGGLDPSVEAIVALRPDLVLAWEHDKRGAVREKLAALGVPVFSLRTEDTTDVFRNVANVGRLLGRDSAAARLAATVRGQLDAVRRSVAGLPPVDVLYVVYNDPPMTAGPNTFIAQLVGVAGGRTIFPDARQLWPTVAMEEIVRRDPDLLIVPQGEFRSNALAVMRQRAGWRELRAVRAGRVAAVDANLTSRPGPHIGEAARALRAAIHPEPAPATAARP